MSNSIFPIPPGNISGGSRGWPIGKYAEFATIVETPAAIRGETLISTTPYAIWQFDMTFPKLNSTFNDQTGYLAKVAGFFMQMGGQARTWLYDDATDNTIPAGAPATFALGDGATKAFQLTRPIGGYADIIQNLNGAASIYLAGVLKTAGTDYSIDSLGVVTFVVAPGLNVVVAWSGKYYFRCRFTKDACDQLSMVFTNYWTLKQLGWKSVII
jgi:hypothetical protein